MAARWSTKVVRKPARRKALTGRTGYAVTWWRGRSYSFTNRGRGGLSQAITDHVGVPIKLHRRMRGQGG